MVLLTLSCLLQSPLHRHFCQIFEKLRELDPCGTSPEGATKNKKQQQKKFKIANHSCRCHRACKSYLICHYQSSWLNEPTLNACKNSSKLIFPLPSLSNFWNMAFKSCTVVVCANVMNSSPIHTTASVHVTLIATNSTSEQSSQSTTQSVQVVLLKLYSLLVLGEGSINLKGGYGRTCLKCGTFPRLPFRQNLART